METPYHTHDGIGSPRIMPKDLLGFPLFSALPTHKAEEETIIFAEYGGFLRLFVMHNRVWTQLAIAPAFNNTGGLSVNGLTVGGGTPITSVLSNTGTLDFGAILPNTSADLTVTLTGAAIGDTISIGIADTVISMGTNCANITFFAWVSATNTVKIRCTNNDAALTANPASGTFRVTTIKF